MQHPIRQAPNPLIVRPCRPEQTLAAAVLSQAVIDAQNEHQSERCRTDATAFLLGGGAMFAFWTGVAGLETEHVRALAQRNLRARPRRAHHPHRFRDASVA